MNRDELERILPHRPPMLLLDESEVVGGEAHGRIAIRGDEFFLQGHFPNNPIVPGVIQCEMLAQNCCVLIADQMTDTQGKTPLYTGLDKVRFKSSIRPGDTVDLVCRLTRSHAPFYFAEGEASVDGRLCCTANMSFALVAGDAAKGGDA